MLSYIRLKRLTQRVCGGMTETKRQCSMLDWRELDQTIK